jgi:hypothetical protein
VLAFSKPEVIKLVTDRFIPIAGDDLLQSHRRDAEGDFFRSLIEPVSNNLAYDSPQGIYICSAKGTLVSYVRNPSQDMDAKALLLAALGDFERLPSSERGPGAVQVPDLVADPAAEPQPPAEGLTLRVHTRCLERHGSHWSRSSKPLEIHNMRFAATAQNDHLWMTHDEVAGMVPAKLEKGERVPMPESLATRLCTLYLADTTRDGSGWWQALEIVSKSIHLTVDSTTDHHALLRIEGSVELARERGADVRSMKATLQGLARYSKDTRQFTTWDMVVLGELRYLLGSQWVEQPMGFAFERADGTLATDSLPPRKLSTRMIGP